MVVSLDRYNSVHISEYGGSFPCMMVVWVLTVKQSQVHVLGFDVQQVMTWISE